MNCLAIDRFRAALGLSAALLAISLGGCHKAGEALPPEALVPPDQSSGVKVTVEPVVEREVQRIVGLLGTLHGYEEVSLGAKVPGRVVKVGHDVGDRVTAGELLLEIERTDHVLNVRQAEQGLNVELSKLGLTKPPPPNTVFDATRVPMVVQAQLKLDNAKLRLERAQNLVAKKAASFEELTERQSEFRVAQAEFDNQVLLAQSSVASIKMKQEALAMVEQQLHDCEVRVPTPSQPIPGDQSQVDYVVTARLVSEGSYVMAGEQLYQLMIDRPLKFRGTVPERKSGEVRLGQTAYLSSSAYSQYFPGEVTRINPAINSSTRTFEVEILIPNKDGALKPGGFAKTAIMTALDKGAITVPLESLVTFAGVTKVFLYERGKAKEVQVVLGVQETDWVEIVSPPLAPGSQVITSGQTAIADGTDVAIRRADGRRDSPAPKVVSPAGDEAPVARRQVSSEVAP